MFHTLRSKLVVSYILLVLLSLLLSGVAAGILVTGVQRKASLGRTQMLAGGLAQWIRAQPNLRARVPGVMERLQREATRLNGRILLLSRDGRVIIDSFNAKTPAETYVDQRVPLPKRAPLQPSTPLNVRRHTFPDGKDYFLVYLALPDAQQDKTRAEFLAIALEVRQIDPPWRELLSPLLLIGGVVMLLAVGVAFVLANSITHPVAQMTQAAAEIANGNYEHTIRAQGNDEIARLARSFSYMAQEVARAQRAQRDFLANVSHDLKTPLTSIQGFSQAILEGAVTDDKGYRRAAEIINAESDRMARLVQDLLELARLEGRQLDLAPEPISVAQLVHSEMDKAEVRAKQAQVELVASIPDGLPRIVADAHRLEQAFANLIDNAIKYSKPESHILCQGEYFADSAPRPELFSVAFGDPPTSGSWICMGVTNRSEPILAADLARIFDRFYRGDKSRKRAAGSGLGLAIVRETILAHKGYIEVSSQAEQGTCFRVWLPVNDRDSVKS